MSGSTYGEAMLKMMRLEEAMASVALSHPPSCACVTCRAAGGDPRARAEILVMLGEDLQER